MILINEHHIGTCKMTNDLEESFLESCKHNKTTPEDMAYFRSYVWNLFAMMFLKTESQGEPRSTILRSEKE